MENELQRKIENDMRATCWKQVYEVQVLSFVWCCVLILGPMPFLLIVGLWVWDSGFGGLRAAGLRVEGWGFRVQGSAANVEHFAWP